MRAGTGSRRRCRAAARRGLLRDSRRHQGRSGCPYGSRVVHRPGRRTFHILLGEQALYTHLGGPEVMRHQLRRLQDATYLPGLSLGIIPACARLLFHPGGGFSIFDDSRVEVEGYRGAETIADQGRAGVFRKAFGLLQPSGVYAQAARDLITSALAVS
ncbi:Scr1 family TA system antitoxin-like transcriptional regulator [Streptomyces sp. NPDC058301]|uniref:Scr1 family TA system antitoxin-like transcriptional regulator n=1 Tax=Streptomyces sp. NPDC058301 TaxID=3346436 RepID=UPI0036E801CA